MISTRAHGVVLIFDIEGPIETYTDLLRNNNRLDVWFRRTMCERGIFMIPTALKRNHVSAAHTQAVQSMGALIPVLRSPQIHVVITASQSARHDSNARTSL